MDAELREALVTTRAAVKALNRQARVTASLLADLERRFEQLESQSPQSPGGIAINGNSNTSTPTAAAAA